MSSVGEKGQQMTSERIAEIRSLPLFRDISDESFEALTRGVYVQNFPPHTELISEGEAADFLHIVLSGSVELFGSWAGRETTIATVWPLSTFILAATISDKPNLMSGRTLGKSQIVMVPSEDVRAVFEADSEFAKAIVAELAVCYRASIKNTKNLKLRTSKERLANYLVKCHRRHGDNPEFELEYEKRRLASYLGMTPENLSRAFNALKSYGVRVDGQNVCLTKADALIAFAKPTDLIDGYENIDPGTLTPRRDE
jgi:CRP/FNR family transcriptional regulator, transcriptional activator FtrB